MIIFKNSGDIFKSQAQTLVAPVNTYGVMGNGLALAFKNRYPGLDAAYKKACRYGVFKQKGYSLFRFSETRNILCFPTKKDWRNPSELIWIDISLEAIVRDFEECGITSLAVPALGCGKGQLEWEHVLPLIQHHLDPLPIDVEIYTP